MVLNVFAESVFIFSIRFILANFGSLFWPMMLSFFRWLLLFLFCFFFRAFAKAGQKRRLNFDFTARVAYKVLHFVAILEADQERSEKRREDVMD